MTPWLVLSLACGPEPGGAPDLDRSGARVWTPEEESAVVEVANTATLVELDVDAALDSRAATGIVAHRDGPDGLPGTADDDLLDDLAEVDAVSWVGSSALNALADYAAAIGLLGAPVDSDAAVLALVNAASEEELDLDAGLDSRAAHNLVAHRDGPDALLGTADDDPFDDLAEVDAVPWVGAAALDALAAYALAAGYGTPAAIAAPTCVVISEYVEGSGNNNKAVELLNCGPDPIDLGDVGVCLVRNDSVDCTLTAQLPAGVLLDPGQVHVTCRTRGGTFNDPMANLAAACQTEIGSVATFNGDDRLLIFADDDGDGAFVDGPDRALDMLGRVGYRPWWMPWQDVGLRRCDTTPFDGWHAAWFDHLDYFTEHGRSDFTDLGLPPVGGGC
jgi:hypothetical protein